MCILRVRATFLFFFVNGSHVFFLTSDSGEKNISFEKKFRHFCWNCILSVPRTFWGVFIKNVLVFQFKLVFQAKFIELPAEIFQQSSKMLFEPKRFELWRNFSTESSKRHFKCPEEHIYKNNILTLWNKFQLWARKCRICGGKFAALLSNLHFCLRMGNWKNSFERIFTFCDFFRTSWEHVLVSSLYHSRHGVPNWIPPAKRNISIRKDFVRKRFVLSLLWAQFFEHSMKSFGNVVKTSLLVHRSTLRKVIFFEFFKIVFGFWAIIVRTSGENVQQCFQMCILRVRGTFLFFFVNGSHVLFNFGLKRKTY